MLCECLDLVRDLEGIVDATPESDATSSSSSSPSSSSFKQFSWSSDRASGGVRSNTSSVPRAPGRALGRGGSGVSMAASALARARSHTVRYVCRPLLLERSLLISANATYLSCLHKNTFTRNFLCVPFFFFLSVDREYLKMRQMTPTHLNSLSQP